MVLPVYRLRSCVRPHASVRFLPVHLSLRVRLLRGQQLVKCYQVDEKLQQIPPRNNSMQKEADKIDWAGEERGSNVSLFICSRRGKMDRHPAACCTLSA